MTPEDTPRMAERTDRQAQIDGMFDACRQVANSLPLFVIVGTTAMANPLGSDLEHTDERRFNPSGKVFARVEDAAALLRERDAQIANMGANQLVLQEAVATQSDLIATLRAERDAAQQENTTLREALDVAAQDIRDWVKTARGLRDRVADPDHDPSTPHLRGIVESEQALTRIYAALFSSPRPQEPQPSCDCHLRERQVCDICQRPSAPDHSTSQEPGGHQP